MSIHLSARPAVDMIQQGAAVDNYTGGRTSCLIKTGDDHNSTKIKF